MSASGEIRRAKDGGRNNWQTPADLFRYLNAERAYTLDGAADAENALCSRFYSEEMDAFKQCPRDESIFINPPYGNLRPWARLLAKWGQDNSVDVLVPSAPDVGWWNILRAVSTHIIHLVAHENPDGSWNSGRIQFLDPETGRPATGNTTASAIFRMDLSHDRLL